MCVGYHILILDPASVVNWAACHTEASACRMSAIEQLKAETKHMYYLMHICKHLCTCQGQWTAFVCTPQCQMPCNKPAFPGLLTSWGDSCQSWN
jgi:hypothetical protein